jgi:nucleoside 2-deoxyribosyltransferase
MKSVYLASPYGFSRQERELVLPRFVSALEGFSLRVHEPFADSQQVVYSREPGWAHDVGQRDLNAVKTCDATFAIVNGNPPDEGVMIELGAAIALGKTTFLFRDDFRRSADCEDYPLNLMLFTGLPKRGWEDYYYTSLEELANPDKALTRWAAT